MKIKNRKSHLKFNKFLSLIIISALLLIASCQTVQDSSNKNNFKLGDSDYSLDCDPTGSSAKAMACQLAYYTNRERQANQEEPDQADTLNWSDDLADVALDYSQRMCDEGFFDHKDPQGHSMEYRFQEAGVFYVKIGENLARGKTLLPSQAMAMFMNEPPCQMNHRGNVLDNDFTSTGVGTVICGDKTIYTQLFATFDAEDLIEDMNEFCSN